MKKNLMQKRKFEISGKTVTVYPSKTPDCPVVYLNAFGDEGEKVVFTEQGGKVSSLREELTENLTSYMIPEFIVKMPKIPLNANGKPDFARLPVVMKEGDFS